MIPGEYLLADGEIALNSGRPTLTLTVANRGDRPIQVGSHFHFAEVNAALDFDRAAALGMRLNIAAGTAVRFEPGQNRTIELVALAGDRIVVSYSNSRVAEYGSDAKKAWETTVVNPGIPFRLVNGHTLVPNNASTSMVELDRTGKVVKEMKGLSYRPYRVFRR